MNADPEVPFPGAGPPPPLTPSPFPPDLPPPDGLSALVFPVQAYEQPPPLPPPPPPMPSGAVRRRRGRAVWLTVPVAGAVAFLATGWLVVEMREGPSLWPEPRPGVIVLPRYERPTVRHLHPDNGMTHLYGLDGVERPAEELRAGAPPADVFRRTAAAREAWQRAAGSPRVAYLESLPPADLSRFLGNVIAMASVEAARAGHLIDAGQIDDAFGVATNLLRNGAILSGGGPLAQVLVGWDVTESGLRVLRRLTLAASDPAQWEQLLSAAQAARLDPSDALEALRRDAAVLIESPQPIYSSLFVPSQGRRGRPTAVGAVARRLFPILGSTPATSQRHLFAAATLWIAAADPATAGPEADAALERFMAELRGPRIWLDDPLAALLARACLASPRALRERMERAAAVAAATRGMLLVRRYEAVHGHPPASLAEAGIAASDADLTLTIHGREWRIRAGGVEVGPGEFAPSPRR